MKIHDREWFPNPARVRTAVAANNLELQVHRASVDLIDADHKELGLLGKIPSGVVPVLELVRTS